MKHTYQLSGMTCESCEAKVKFKLSLHKDVISTAVSKENNSATIESEKPISVQELQNLLPEKYQISEKSAASIAKTSSLSWLETYRPILLVFAFITGVTLLVQATQPVFSWMQWMRHFMAGFFLVFSFFKLLNLKGFAESYAMYDIVAKKIPFWGYVYAFIELGLGIAYLINFNPFFTNLFTAIVMTVSIIGVLQSVMNKKQIKCACLGAVFNLPMSSITIIEDALMIGMSLLMLFML